MLDDEENDEKVNEEDNEEEEEVINIDETDNWSKIKTELYNYGIIVDKMCNDPLWQKIITNAKKYKNKNKDLDCTVSEGIEHAISKYKPLIKAILKEEEEKVQDNDEETEMEEEEDQQTGAGLRLKAFSHFI